MEELAVVAIVVAFWILLNKLVERWVPLHPARGILNLSCLEKRNAETSQGRDGPKNKEKRMSECTTDMET